MPLTDDDNFLHAGPHRFRFEPPDIIRIENHGIVEVEHVQSILEAMNPVFDTMRPYLIRDVRHSDMPSAALRQYLVNEPRMLRMAAVISIGGAYRIRVVVSMFHRAMRLLRPDSPLMIVVESLDEAYEWIRSHRAKHVAAP